MRQRKQDIGRSGKGGVRIEDQGQSGGREDSAR